MIYIEVLGLVYEGEVEKLVTKIYGEHIIIQQLMLLKQR